MTSREAAEMVALADFGPGKDYDAEAHMRLLRESGGASSGYTADMIERLYAALRAAARPDAGYAVKALEWGKERITDEIGVMAQDAYASIGHYIASDNGWFLQGETGWHYSQTRDEAKAAAQADYEQRIRSALIEQPATPQSLHGMIAAIYGSLDAEDRAWVDCQWIEWRGSELTLATPSYAAGFEACREAAKPFIRALQAIDGGCAPDQLCDNHYSIEAAIFEEDQPTIGDLRKLCEALSALPAPAASAVTAGSRPSDPTPPDTTAQREAVARLIEPGMWDLIGAARDKGLRKWADDLSVPSLAKADAILALTRGGA